MQQGDLVLSPSLVFYHSPMSVSAPFFPQAWSLSGLAAAPAFWVVHLPLSLLSPRLLWKAVPSVVDPGALLTQLQGQLRLIPQVTSGSFSFLHGRGQPRGQSSAAEPSLLVSPTAWLAAEDQQSPESSEMSQPNAGHGGAPAHTSGFVGTHTGAWKGSSLPQLGVGLALAQAVCLQIGVLNLCAVLPNTMYSDLGQKELEPQRGRNTWLC